MSFFFNFFARLFQAMLKLLSFSKSSISNSLSIYIKSNTGGTLSVELDPKWDIKNVKEIVAPQLGLDPDEVKIIFAGKELQDTTIIEDCDLGEQSILHAVRVTKRNKSTAAGPPLSETIEELSFSDSASSVDNTPDKLVTSQTSEKSKIHFYVYCASPCRGVKTGKLRVRCSICKDGAFIVDNDPQSWTDVLEPSRITGDCNSNKHCQGLYAEFYFKCAEHTSQGETDQAVPLYLIRSNCRDIPCLACTEINDPILVFPCDVGHVTCLECFRIYCRSRLRDRQFWSHPEHGYTLSCPAGCSNSFIQESHHFRLLDNQDYDQYQRFGAEEFVLQAGGVLCPQPGCGAGILVDRECTRVQCINGCGYVFCRKCLAGYHLGDCLESGIATQGDSCAYNIDPKNANKARWDEATSVTIKVSTKPCPKCRTATERDGGCMHMVCTRAQCGYHWCWVCQGPWERECMANHWFG